MTKNNANSNELAQAMLETMTPEIHQRFLKAIATGRWPTGQAVSDEQKSLCMEAVILYEHKHVPERERTGFVPPKSEVCDNDSTATAPEAEKPISWR